MCCDAKTRATPGRIASSSREGPWHSQAATNGPAGRCSPQRPRYPSPSEGASAGTPGRGRASPVKRRWHPLQAAVGAHQYHAGLCRRRRASRPSLTGVTGRTNDFCRKCALPALRAAMGPMRQEPFYIIFPEFAKRTAFAQIDFKTQQEPRAIETSGDLRWFTIYLRPTNSSFFQFSIRNSQTKFAQRVFCLNTIVFLSPV